ncbi:MAG: AmmeMemoRadiSam system protein B [Planctomycetota bacterium]
MSAATPRSDDALPPGDLRPWVDAQLRNWRISEDIPQELSGALIPHGSLTLCGRIAARTLHTLIIKRHPTTLLFLTTPHGGTGTQALISTEKKWSTPVGRVDADSLLVDSLLSLLAPALRRTPPHTPPSPALSTVLPLVAALAPGMRVLFIAIPDGVDAPVFGQRLGRLLSEQSKVSVVGVSDLTHYGEKHGFAPSGLGQSGADWLVENDARLVTRVQNLAAESILAEARAQRSACCAPAIAAAVAVARARDGWAGHLIGYTNSYLESGSGVFTDGIGYAGVVF